MNPSAVQRYAFAIVVVVLTLIVDIAAAPWLHNAPLFILLLPIALAAWYGGIGPGLTAAITAAIGANIFLMDPLFGVSLATNQIIATVVFVIVASIIGVLTGRARRGELAAMKIGEHLRVTLASIGDGVIVADAAARVTFVNRVASSMMGIQSEEAIGQSIDQVFPLIDEASGIRTESPVTVVLREGVAVQLKNGFRLVRGDGTSLPISDSCAPIRNSAGKVEGAVLVFRDQTSQREAEQGRAYLAAIVESSSDAIKGKTLDGTVTTWNAAAEQLYGYSASEIIGQNISMLIPPDRPHELLDLMASVGRGEPIENYQTQRVRKDGRLIDVSISVSQIQDHSGKVIGTATIARDITSQKLLERRQRLLADVAGVIDDAQLDLTSVLQAIVQFVSETIGDGALIQVATPDGAFLTPVALYDPNDEIRALWWEMVSAAPLSIEEGLTGKVFRTGEPILVPVLNMDDMRGYAPPSYVPYVEKMRLRGTLMVPLRARGRTLGVLGISRHTNREPYTLDDQVVLQDLANRAGMAIDNARLYREAQELAETRGRLSAELSLLALAEQKARSEAQFAAERATQLRRIAEELGTALTVTDVANAIITHAFVTLEVHAGGVVLLNADQATLSLIASVGYPPDIVEAFRRYPIDTPIPVADVIRTGLPLWIESTSKATSQHPTADFIRTDISYGAFAAIPITIGGLAIGSIGLQFAEERVFTADDRVFMLTVAAQSAQALERARAYEAEQSAVGARDEFLAVAAHEIRTPITTMRGYAQLALRRLNSDSAPDHGRLATSLEQIVQQADRLTDLVSRLLDISRIQAGKLVIEPRATELFALITHVTDRMEWSAPGRILHVRGASEVMAIVDPVRFEQVIVNLLDNAVKFSPESSPIEIEVENHDSTQMGFTRVSVRDHGIGVPLAARASLFERFQQAHGEGHAGGMGLGLYVCRQIIELHGGNISAEFPEDGGTRIVIDVPMRSQISATAISRDELGNTK